VAPIWVDVGIRKSPDLAELLLRVFLRLVSAG
jgi:hypothetical protein